MTITACQAVVLVKVARANLEGRHYRAEGHGERVTLASLFHRRYLDRHLWRGNAHEYALHPALREGVTALLRERGYIDPPRKAPPT